MWKKTKQKKTPARNGPPKNVADFPALLAEGGALKLAPCGGLKLAERLFRPLLRGSAYLKGDGQIQSDCQPPSESYLIPPALRERNQYSPFVFCNIFIKSFTILYLHGIRYKKLFSQEPVVLN
jgi:hypothetical protein